MEFNISYKNVASFLSSFYLRVLIFVDRVSGKQEAHSMSYNTHLSHLSPAVLLKRFFTLFIPMKNLDSILYDTHPQTHTHAYTRLLVQIGLNFGIENFIFLCMT